MKQRASSIIRIERQPVEKRHNKKKGRRKPRELNEIPRRVDSGSFDFEAWKRKILNDPVSRAAVEDFLKYRHRDWEQ
jgi:hypothetical protein